MVCVTKQNQPSSLVGYKQQTNAKYDGANFTPIKEDIRKNLLDEQYYLCAYCMQRIYNDGLSTKIEHWHCQQDYKDESLDYKNMLAVCRGNEGQPSKSQHCDTKKGSSKLKYNPSSLPCIIENTISYQRNGKIESSDKDFNGELNDILNLNIEYLTNNRAAVYESINEALSKKPDKRTKAEIQKLIDKWQSTDENNYKKEYFGVAVYLLNKKLQRCAK